MLNTLASADVGGPPTDLEGDVWSRIDAEAAARRASPSISFQIAVALTTLVIGISVGWSATTTNHPTLGSILGDDYAQYGPLSRLTGGL